LKNGQYYYNGAFEFTRHSSGSLNLVNTVSLADYIKGVLPYEMDGSWPLEALKAQALCARSYLLSNMGRHSGFDICSSTHCQVYYGTEKETESVRRAVEETMDEVITYEGKIIGAYFFSSSGGYTESAKNVGGGNTAPYCAAVPDPFENPDSITHFSTTVNRTQLTSLASYLGAGIGQVVDCYVSEYTEPAHNVYAVTLVGESGKTYTVKGCDNVRIKFSSYVKSPRFDILSCTPLYADDGQLPRGELAVVTEDGLDHVEDRFYVIDKNGIERLTRGDSDGTFTFVGSGFGHNVGMSQYGARGMAEQGYTYREIIHHYFTDVEIMTLDEL
ncbi:MAG: SpoIID/LytB domain-containing protein, partial [Clostridia bacterium]|nr:SpoIID/LytB domain-containing protein [Clostridia bacterium]